MINKDTVKYIANLSRLHVDEEEAQKLSKNLENILGYIQKLEKLDVTDVKPTSHVLPLENVFRKDEIKPSLSQDEALSISIAKLKGAFKVPQIIE